MKVSGTNPLVKHWVRRGEPSSFLPQWSRTAVMQKHEVRFPEGPWYQPSLGSNNIMGSKCSWNMGGHCCAGLLASVPSLTLLCFCQKYSFLPQFWLQNTELFFIWVRICFAIVGFGDIFNKSSHNYPVCF